jgi:hypothetical protein
VIRDLKQRNATGGDNIREVQSLAFQGENLKSGLVKALFESVNFLQGETYDLRPGNDDACVLFSVEGVAFKEARLPVLS